MHTNTVEPAAAGLAPPAAEAAVKAAAVKAVAKAAINTPSTTPTTPTTPSTGPAPIPPFHSPDDPYPSLSPAALRKLLLPNTAHCRTYSPSPTPQLPVTTPDSSSVAPAAPLNTAGRAHVSASLLEDHSPASHALRRKLVHGTHCLVVQGGSLCKGVVYQRLHALGVHVHILDTCRSPWNPEKIPGATDNKEEEIYRKSIASFIRFDGLFDEHNLTLDQLRLVLPADIDFHAALTYYEDATVQAALIACALGIAGPDVTACRYARSKAETRRVLAASGLPTPRHFNIRQPDELETAIETVGFPAVLKPAFGAASIGVTKVCDAAAARDAYGTLWRQMETDGDPLWTQGTDVLLEQFYAGDEFDVDVVLSHGEAVYAKVSDNWGVRPPYFQETGMHTPSLYPCDKQAELIDMATRSAQALGFVNGVLHVECRYTPDEGARIIEVNGRMGGDPVYDFNRLAWGIDLVECHYYCTLGISVRIDADRIANPRCAVAEFVFNAPCSGTVDSHEWLDEIERARDDVLRVVYFKRCGERVTGPEDGVPDWLAEIVVTGHDGQRALLEVVRDIVTKQVRVPIVADDGGSKAAEKPLAFFFPHDAYPFGSDCGDDDK